MGMSQLKRVEVYRRDWALSATGNIKVEVPSDQMPSGLIHSFRVRLVGGTIANFGAAVANYQKVLRTITYGASMPKFNVMTAVPGEYWDAVLTSLMRKAPSRTTPVAGGFALNTYLPFSWMGSDRFPSIRRKDTALLNINNKALPFLSLGLGPVTDLSAAGTACTVTVIVEVEYEPIVRAGFTNPDNPLLSGDQPLKMLEIAVNQKSDLSANCIHRFLTAGDREVIGIVSRELVIATGAIASNTFTLGTATPSKYVFTRGDSDSYTSDVKVETLDSEMNDELGIAIQAGHHYWFAAARGSLAHAVDLRGGQPFALSMDNVAQAGTNLLEFMQIGTIDLPQAIKDIHSAQLTPAKP